MSTHPFNQLGSPMEKEAFIQRAIDGAWNATAKPVGAAIGKAVGGVGNAVGGAAKTLWNVATMPVNAGFGAMGSAWKGLRKGGLGGAVQGAWDGMTDSIKTDTSDMWNGVKQTASGVYNTATGVPEAMARGAIAPVTAAYGAATGYGTSQAPGSAYGIHASQNPVNTAQNTVPGQPAGNVASPVQTSPQSPVQFDINTPIPTAVKSAFAALQKSAMTAFPTLDSVPAVSRDAAKGVVQGAQQTGSQLGSELKSGLSRWADGFKNITADQAIDSVANTAIPMGIGGIPRIVEPAAPAAPEPPAPQPAPQPQPVVKKNPTPVARKAAPAPKAIPVAQPVKAQPQRIGPVTGKGMGVHTTPGMPRPGFTGVRKSIRSGRGFGKSAFAALEKEAGGKVDAVKRVLQAAGAGAQQAAHSPEKLSNVPWGKLLGGSALGGGALYTANRMGRSSGRTEGVGEGYDAGAADAVSAARQQAPGGAGYFGNLWDAIKGNAASNGVDPYNVYGALSQNRDAAIQRILNS